MFSTIENFILLLLPLKAAFLYMHLFGQVVIKIINPFTNILSSFFVIGQDHILQILSNDGSSLPPSSLEDFLFISLFAGIVSALLYSIFTKKMSLSIPIILFTCEIILFISKEINYFSKETEYYLTVLDKGVSGWYEAQANCKHRSHVLANRWIIGGHSLFNKNAEGAVPSDQYDNVYLIWNRPKTSRILMFIALATLPMILIILLSSSIFKRAMETLNTILFSIVIGIRYYNGAFKLFDNEFYFQLIFACLIMGSFILSQFAVIRFIIYFISAFFTLSIFTFSAILSFYKYFFIKVDLFNSTTTQKSCGIIVIFFEFFKPQPIDSTLFDSSLYQLHYSLCSAKIYLLVTISAILIAYGKISHDFHIYKCIQAKKRAENLVGDAVSSF